MYQTGCNAYRQSASNIIEDNRVVLLKLYDGTLRFLSLAKRGILEKKPNVRGENISKTLAIVSELECALDMKQGGDIANQLSSLYRFVTDELTTANRDNDLMALAQAESILTTLKEGFEGAIKNQKAEAQVVMTPSIAAQPRGCMHLAF